MSDQLISVPFRAETLYIVEHLNQPFVPMKPVVEAIGLDWRGQQAKIRAAQRYGDISIPLHSPGGMQDTLCIPLRKLNGWLFSINPAKVKPELRDTILAYQEECFQVLFEYWHNGVARRDDGRDDVDDLAGEETPLSPPPRSRFDALDAGLMRELRRVNDTLVQAYLVDHGITPAYVASLLGDGAALPAPEAAQSAAPLEVLAARVATIGPPEDEDAWYLERHQWMQLTEGYDPRHTALWLRDIGLLRTNDGRLTWRASPRLFDGQRPVVFCLLKSLLQRPGGASWGVPQQQHQGRNAHVQ
ncbi:MAG: phage antirepressor N-terminal domain-containing protein [Gammaproteobacteria bacterium]